jgi:hypothetical protein
VKAGYCIGIDPIIYSERPANGLSGNASMRLVAWFGLIPGRQSMKLAKLTGNIIRTAMQVPYGNRGLLVRFAPFCMRGAFGY